MLNSSIESAVTASSARTPSEKAASTPAEPATLETEVSARSFSKRSWLSGPAEKKKIWLDAVSRNAFVSETGRGHKLEFSAWPPVSLPVRPLPSSETEKEEETDSLLIKGAMEPVRDEHRGLYTNMFLVKKQDGGPDLSDLKGPKRVYKDTNFHDGNVEKRSSVHQERRLGGYNVKDSSLIEGAIEPVRDEHRGFYSNLFLFNKLIYKETSFHDGNVERRFSEHQGRRLGGYNRP